MLLEPTAWNSKQIGLRILRGRGSQPASGSGTGNKVGLIVGIPGALAALDAAGETRGVSTAQGKNQEAQASMRKNGSRPPEGQTRIGGAPSTRRSTSRSGTFVRRRDIECPLVRPLRLRCLGLIRPTPHSSLAPIFHGDIAGQHVSGERHALTGERHSRLWRSPRRR